jgi:hypothetical protein
VAEEIPLLQAGKTPTFLEAAFANQVLNLLKSIASMSVNPAGAGTFVATQQNAILDLTGLSRRIDAVALQVQQQTPPQLADVINRLTNLENAVTNLGDQINNINTRLDNASAEASAVCNDNGTITINIVLNI